MRLFTCPQVQPTLSQRRFGLRGQAPLCHRHAWPLASCRHQLVSRASHSAQHAVIAGTGHSTPARPRSEDRPHHQALGLECGLLSPASASQQIQRYVFVIGSGQLLGHATLSTSEKQVVLRAKPSWQQLWSHWSTRC